jgi:hypothetical protein
MAKNFNKIKTNVAIFRAQFDVYVKGAGNQLAKEVTDLQGKVKELEVKLEGLTKTVRRRPNRWSFMTPANFTR